MRRSTPSRILSAGLALALGVALVPLLPLATAVAVEPDLHCVTFADASTGYAAGDQGTVLKTVDGGASWASVRSGDSEQFRGVSFVDADNGWVVTSTGAVYRTSDGGSEWTLTTEDLGGGWWAPLQIGDIEFVSATEGWAAGGVGFGAVPGLVFKSNGFSWGSLVPELKTYYFVGEQRFDGDDIFHALDFVDASLGWAVGVEERVTPNVPCIWQYNTSRGSGSNAWARQSVPGGSGKLFDVSFKDASTGVAVGSGGKILRTANGGGSWSALSSPTTSNLYGVALADATRGWAVGADGKIATSSNSGASWTPSTSGTAYDLYGVASPGGTVAVAVGEARTILRTTNGDDWSSVTQDATPPSVDSVSSSTHPVEATWYPDSDPDFSWTASDASGIAGYSYTLDQIAATVPDTVSEGTGTSTSYAGKADGVWYFHVRARDGAGNWGPPAHRAARIDTTPPSVGAVSSSTHPDEGSWYSNPDPAFSWTGSDASGIGGYSYTLDQSATTTPDTVSEGTGTSTSYTGKADGVWYFHVRARDGAGNWGPAAHRAARIDTGVSIESIAGDNRFETAIKASRAAFPVAGSVETVVVATGRNWPDALGGAALAAAKGGPILLTDTASLPAGFITELRRLGADRAVILGGGGAVGAGVESALKAELGSAPGIVTRIGGSDRYRTAEMIAAATVAAIESTGEYDGTAFVATGSNFPDALAASPLAAANGWPIYLAGPSGLARSTRNAMAGAGVSDVLILGGTGAVSGAIEKGLKTTYGSAHVKRLSGTNRYATGVAVAVHGVTQAGLSWNSTAISTGEDFPDALAGGVLQGRDGGVLLLTDSAVLSAEPRAAIVDNRTAILQVRFLGSTGSVGQAVRDRVEAILN